MAAKNIEELLAFLKEKFPENWFDNYILPEVQETLSDVVIVDIPGDIHNTQALPVDQDASQEDIPVANAIEIPEVANPEVADNGLTPSIVIDLDGYKLIEDVDATIDYIFDTFYISTLSGEYIVNKNFILHLTELEEFIDRNFIFEPANEDVQIILDEQIKKKLVGSIKVAIKFYFNFYKLLETYNKYTIDVVTVSNPATNNLIRGASITTVIRDKILFYRHVTSVCTLDHFLSDDVEVYENLIDIENSLNILSLPPATPNRFSNVLKKKVQYLKFKWESRQRTLFGKQKDISSVKSYLVDDELIIINKDTNSDVRNSGVLGRWQDHLEAHYEIGEWEQKIQAEILNIDRFNLQSLTVLELHRLIKYYKDISKNYQNLEEVVTEIKRRLEINAEKETFYIIYSYALNNLFSLLLTLEDKKDSDIDTLRQQIGSLQDKTKIDNFFVEYKYIEYLINELEKKFDSRAILNSIKSEVDNIEKAGKLLNSYRKKLNWSQNHYNCIFQLPYIECLIDSDIPELPKVYYASSFVLPLSKSDSQYNYDELAVRHSKLAIATKVIASLDKEFELIDETTKSVKDNDFKSIEVIGIFTAIITFVMVTIPAFKFINNIPSAVFFTISTACSLGLFLNIIFSLRKGVLSITKNRMFFISVGSLLTITVCSLLMQCDANSSVKKDAANYKVTKDSLRDVRDSLVKVEDSLIDVRDSLANVRGILQLNLKNSDPTKAGSTVNSKTKSN